MSLKSTFLALWYKLSKLGEGAEEWVRGNLDKIQKNSYFFRETFPKTPFSDGRTPSPFLASQR